MKFLETGEFLIERVNDGNRYVSYAPVRGNDLRTSEPLIYIVTELFGELINRLRVRGEIRKRQFRKKNPFNENYSEFGTTV